MRILVLSKRQYMGKDLLDDAYGRFYELPLELARLGHEVQGLCASYRPRCEGEMVAHRETASVTWRARNVRPFSPLSLYRWVVSARRAVSDFRPDIIWACSDAFHAILGAHLQRYCRVPCVIDLYDNFESYPATRIPGVLPSFRASVRQAAGITCVSPALQCYVRERYTARGATLVLENGVSAEFRPHDRTDCRRRLGLPINARIIGTAGAIGRARGTEVLFESFLHLMSKDPDLYLLLAGQLLEKKAIPPHHRIVYLGQLPTAQVPTVIGAMDISVICNRRSTFGDYCFPQKLHEIVACGVPPLVARTPGVVDLLELSPRHAYEPGSAASLTEAIEAMLNKPEMPRITPVTWAQHSTKLHHFLQEIASRSRMPE